MGRQILIAQSSADEHDIITALDERYDLLCLPRLFDAPRPGVSRLSELPNRQLILFLRDYADDVVKRITPVLEKPGSYQVFPRTGLVIEWSRTEPRAGRQFVPGRFFFDTREPVNADCAATMSRIMGFLQRRIRDRYPLGIGRTRVLHVGPALSAMVTSGFATLVHSGGTPIPL